MIDATISRVRMRPLGRLGRSRVGGYRCAAPTHTCASGGETVTDASSIADGLPARPRAARARPEAGDLMASIIWPYGRGRVRVPPHPPLVCRLTGRRSHRP